MPGIRITALTRRMALSAWLMAVGLHSCGEKKNPVTNLPPKAEVFADHDDSIPGGIPFAYQPRKIDADSIQPPRIVKAGVPVVEEAHLNIHRVGSPGISLVSTNPTVKTPGIDGVKLPTETKAVFEEKANIYSKPVPSGPPATKDVSSYNIQYFDVDQGLSSSYVFWIEQDRRGNLWFSTMQMGVCVYDGQSFTHFETRHGLVDNYIWTICEDSKGNIWFGSDGSGMACYDGSKFFFYEEKGGLPDPKVIEIMRGEKDMLWLATRAGLCKFDGKTYINYGPEQGLLGTEIKDIAMGKNGNILIATDEGLCIYDGVSFTHYTAQDGLPFSYLNCVYQDREDNIWVGSDEFGICQFDGYSFFHYSTEQGLSGDNIDEIKQDSFGNIWIGTSENGITIFDHNTFTHITDTEGLSNNAVRAIHEDNQGNIWIGTYGGGVNKYSGISFQNFTEGSGLPHPIIRHMDEDRNSDLWFAHERGVSKYSDGKFSHYDQESGLSANFVRVVFNDSKGNLWLGTNDSGLNRYDGENFYHYTGPQGINSGQILAIFEGRDSNIYVGSKGGGVTMFAADGVYQFDLDDPRSNNTVRAIAEDQEGNLWFGTNGGGACKWDGDSMTIYKESQGIESPSILCFLPRHNGELWLGTENSGAFRYDKGKMIRYGTEDGLSNEIVWSMIEDPDGNMWLGTERGLNRLTFDDTGAFQVKLFNKLDGLKGVDFFPNSVCLDNESRIWWGSGKALIMLDLNKYQSMNTAPRVAIRDVELHQTFVEYRQLKDTLAAGYSLSLNNENKYLLDDVKFDDVDPFTNCPSNLELPYTLNHVTFHFAAIDWSAPHKLSYQYKLDGLDEDWSPILTDNKAVFNNIPEGSYTFKLRAIGDAMIWSEIVEFPLIIHAPWYRTTFAYISYFVGGILLVIVIIYWRTRQLVEHKRELEATVKDRTIEVVHQKELVEMKNKEITDSITYAKRIQEAILPNPVSFSQMLDESFILFKPKDIVAGDFYWLQRTADKILIAAADCTGHGVPGAMVSVVCNNALNRAVREFGLSKPSLILNKVRDLVIETFDTGKKGIKDGMDIALLSLDLRNNTVEYAGANNNLYHVSEGNLKVIEADKQPIGKYAVNRDFTNHEIKLVKGDNLYISTDGFMDQFGGSKGKKFKYVPFMELLVKVNGMSMYAQRDFINSVFEKWRSDYEQVDDVCVIGVRI